ncbi:hypothetical protein BLNAU_17026 [Blattamonas nauphoetae]|uniref:Uncharacterized protein n=1 Tax=Blattamonas nauphoetae TaxID=2049346 RepID=A0ABQ9X8R5_9EUKA|nr:hypothetical protein BLNAU_17026 [Blattamonas nauphoetae]
MNTLIHTTDTSSNTARSDVSSPHLPLPMDCSPFLNWDENRLRSTAEWTVVFQSLVATVKAQPALDVTLEAKAVRHHRSSDEMVEGLMNDRSAEVRLAFIKADLIPKIINTLNPLSLSFVEAVDIHINLMTIIGTTVWLSRPYPFRRLEIKDNDEQQAVHEIVLKQVLAPTEKYLYHLCVNRYSIIDGDQSTELMTLLAQILEISQYYQPTMDFVVNVPVFLTIPSCLTFFEDEDSIWCFLDGMNDTHREWNEKRDEEQQIWKTVHRVLRMEGIEDVTEQIRLNDKNGIEGGWIVENLIEWNNLQGMNLSKLR